MAKPISSAKRQADQLFESLRDFKIGPVLGDHERVVILGVTDKGVFVDGQTADGFLAHVGQLLLDSKRVYCYGNSIVFEIPEDQGGMLKTLAVEGRAEPNAQHILSNLFVTGVERDGVAFQSLVAPKLVHAVLADESLMRRLRPIRHYARRPTFDRGFLLCHHGWNPESDILVHGPEVVPTPWEGDGIDGGRAVDRLPPRLRELLREFDWRLTLTWPTPWRCS
jgi:hypothetical protein